MVTRVTECHMVGVRKEREASREGVKRRAEGEGLSEREPCLPSDSFSLQRQFIKLPPGLGLCCLTQELQGHKAECGLGIS